MFNAKDYDVNFYKKRGEQRFETARQVLKTLFRFYKPKSVIDIGCGLGHWLKVCQDEGINNIQGYDGHFVDRSFLEIPQESFIQHNLEEPLKTDMNYDLVMSIEVGEHLPELKADLYVKSLTQAGDVVLFSAAAPYQGGKNHCNEQPPAYWAKLFTKHGFVCFDFLRNSLWDNDKVNCVHRQNILVFVEKSKKVIFEKHGFKETNSPKLMYHPVLINKRMKAISGNRKLSSLFRNLLKRFLEKEEE